jgi:hypothetical protein
MPARFGEPERFQPRRLVRRGHEPIEGSVEAAIGAIEQRVFVWREACVAEDRVRAGGVMGA